MVEVEVRGLDESEVGRPLLKWQVCFQKKIMKKDKTVGDRKWKLFTKGHLEHGMCQIVTHPSVVKSSVITSLDPPPYPLSL